MYAHAAQLSPNSMLDPHFFFKQARSMLDGYLDIPRLSTVVALCLLALYESSQHKGDTQCRSWVYSGMAFRMCLDLGLHKRRCQSGDRTRDIDVELQKRVFWACYCLDKLESICSGRPWMLHGKDIDLDLPLLQPGDDLEEHGTLEYFVACIKLMRLSERILVPDSIYAPRPVIQTQRDEQMSLNFDNELLHWLRTLPPHLQWTPYPTHSNIVPSQPPANAMVAHLHLLYNTVELHVIRPYASARLVHRRCFAVATNITQLSCALAEQTHFILSYQFAAHAITAAVRVHAVDCGSENLSFARHSRVMFQRSLRSLQTLLQHRNIPGIDQFAVVMDWALTLADADSSGRTVISPTLNNRTSISPKFMTIPATRRESSPLSLPSSQSVLNYAGEEELQKSVEATNTNDSPLSSFWRPPSPRILFDDAKGNRNANIKTPYYKHEETNKHQKGMSDDENRSYASHSKYSGSRADRSWKKPSSSQTHDSDLLYSLWQDSHQEKRKGEGEVDRQHAYSNIGLGVYASAHQHRDDVINQHIHSPGSKFAVVGK
ncbi:hypothetical protein DFQ28_008645 [Apophysomyces sp. BC1034]|nr:hypothetical protein DFQ30_004984 [Apophysomyces sp. BC1015]KAG0168563.1 hypothetical protein DFQ29_010098 [Apophysomyces sp. BC1021]KAG0185866.1 hypothetical protein DFQ28_008645 [Apophysomyces sp. BC1034]